MNAAIMVLCMTGPLAVGQDAKPLFQAPGIEVLTRSQEDGSVYHYLMYNRVYMGRNYDRPKKEKDRGKPSVDFSRLPTTYFHDKSPIGVVMQKYDWFPGRPNTYAADARLPASLIGMGGDVWGQVTHLWSEPPVAVLGMDVATMASYARPTQVFHFTERVPTFVKLSLPKEKEKQFFHYAQDALDRGTALKVFEGEPRETMEKNDFDAFYQLIVIETYKLPVIEVHKELLTKEAIRMLMSKTREDGILCFHTSNRYYDLVPILASAAKELKLACLHGSDRAEWEKDERRDDRFTSDWVLIAREWDHLAHLKPPQDYDKQENRFGEKVPFWDPPKITDKKFIWTDKGENSFRGIYRSDPKIDLLIERIHDFEFWALEKTNMFQLQRHTRPFYDSMRNWSKSSADAMNRDPESPKSAKDKK
jgi:hypothetical protein